MNKIGLVLLSFSFTATMAWAVNLVQLTDCDFKEDYKCEVMHGLGVVPIISLGTVWMGTDKDE